MKKHIKIEEFEYKSDTNFSNEALDNIDIDDAVEENDDGDNHDCISMLRLSRRQQYSREVKKLNSTIERPASPLSLTESTDVTEESETEEFVLSGKRPQPRIIGKKKKKRKGRPAPFRRCGKKSRLAEETPSKSFACRACGKAYVAARSLWRHEKYECVTVRPPLSCDRCPYKTPHEGRIQRHKQKHQDEDLNIEKLEYASDFNATNEAGDNVNIDGIAMPRRRRRRRYSRDVKKIEPMIERSASSTSHAETNDLTDVSGTEGSLQTRKIGKSKKKREVRAATARGNVDLDYGTPPSRTFPCPNCGKTYAASRSLWRHEKYECVNAGPSVSCDLCSYTSRHKWGLQKHNKKHHNGGASRDITEQRQAEALIDP